MSEFISRKKYVKPKTIQEQYDISLSMIYELVKKKEFESAVVHVGKSVRIDQDRFFELINQIYR